MLAALGDHHVVLRLQDDRITESSGLVDLGDTMATINDSGNAPVVYVVDAGSGRTVGTTTYANDQVDTEALAPAGPGQVWVGDIGDNRESRKDIAIYRVPVGRGDRAVTAPRFVLAYPDGPHDAESLFVSGGRLFVITKSFAGGAVYAAPTDLKRTGNRLRRVGSVPGFLTDAAMLDPEHLLVRGYGSATLLTWPALAPVQTWTLPHQQQGEGLSVGPRERIRLSSEGARSTVLQVGVPASPTVPGAVAQLVAAFKRLW